MDDEAPSERTLLHSRDYAFRGYRRADGLFDIEGRLTDTKGYDFDNAWRGRIAAGEPLHEMWIRVTLDDSMTVCAIEARTTASPYAICPAITDRFDVVVGLQVGPGWRRGLKERLGGVQGCTHLVEMLGAMATVAFQTIAPVRKREDAPDRRPALIDSCHAYASDGPVVRQFWPRFYTGA